MKRIIVLLLVLALSCLAFASCDMLPEEVMDKLGPVLEMVGIETPDDHEHDFVFDSKVDPTCSSEGKEIYKCACGETKTESIEKIEHDYKEFGTSDPTCLEEGSRTYRCACGAIKTEKYGEATGHNIAEFVEYSRMMPCTNAGCSYALFPEGNGKYSEVIVYKPELVEGYVASYDAIFAELSAIIEAADKYDPALHGFVKDSELYKANKAMEAKYGELLEIVEAVISQYQIANLEYYLNLDEDTKDNFNYVSEIRTDMVSEFYSFAAPIADSMFREYYYEGMTDAEINAYVAESDAVSNPEYAALVKRNDEIESKYMLIADPSSNSQVPVMYAEFVANNKKIAELLGYENYLAYAYKEIYSRDYSYTDVKTVYDYVKTYITPVYNAMYNNWYYNGSYNKVYGDGSFFEYYDQNKALNDYIDLLTIEGNKTLSFSDSFNTLMGDGLCFKGGKGGTAYVTSLYAMGENGKDLPIAYFSKGYENFFTVVHEFGHYVNEVYSEGMYSQSYDLLEMHSQGNEMLFLAYLNNNPGTIATVGLKFLNDYQPLNMFFAVMHAIAIDAFEQAVYTDFYDGYNADAIMDYDAEAGLYITYDEYDLLFKSILDDLGIDSKWQSAAYWRGAVITSPCYYASYSISALSVLQLLPMGTEDFDAASDAYLKLFSYVDEYANGKGLMSTVEILQYAGLNTFMDEELYKDINEYFMAKYS